MATATKTAKKKSRTTFDEKRGPDTYRMDPENVYLETTPGKKHYDRRVHFPPEEKIVLGIMRRGVKEHVLVEKCEGLAVVVDGRQRVTNAREANRRLREKGLPTKLIPVSTEKGDPLELFEIAVIVNEHRRPEDPISQAQKMQQYIDMGKDQADASELWGVTKRTIQNRLHLLELAPEVQQAVLDDKVPAHKAIVWRDLSFADQIKQLNKKPAKKAVKKRPSTKKVQAVLASNGKLPAPVKAAILWVQGDLTDEDACRKIKGLKKALDGAKKK